MIAYKWQLPLIIAIIGILIWLLSPILSPFIAALLLAWLGNPLVNRLERAGRSRNTAVLLVFSLIFLTLALSLLVLLPMLWQQSISLLEGLPRLVIWFRETALPWLSSVLRRDVGELLDPTQVELAVRAHWQEIGGFVSVALGYVGKSGMAIALVLSNMLLLPFLSYYFLRDWPVMVQRISDLIPRDLLPKTAQIAKESDDILGGFLRGQLLVMVMLGSIYAIGLWLTGLESGLLIGFIAGLVCFVPYLGAVVGVVLAVIASLVQYGDASHLIWVAVVFTVGQLIESYILTPKLVGDRIGLHPVAVIFAIMAGGQLFGFLGVLLALPSAAVINVLLKHLHQRYLKSRVYGEQDTAPVEPSRPDV